MFIFCDLQPELTAADIALPNINDAFVEELKRSGISYSDDPTDRLFRAHGKHVNYLCGHIKYTLHSAFGENLHH